MAKSRIARLLEVPDPGKIERHEAINDMSRTELVEAIKICMSGIPDEQEFVVRFLTRCLPGVFDSDLIFYPFKNMDVEDTVDEILLRQGIKREGGQAALNVHYQKAADQVLLNPDAKPWSIEWAQSVKRRLS